MRDFNVRTLRPKSKFGIQKTPQERFNERLNQKCNRFLYRTTRLRNVLDEIDYVLIRSRDLIREIEDIIEQGQNSNMIINVPDLVHTEQAAVQRIRGAITELLDILQREGLHREQVNIN